MVHLDDLDVPGGPEDLRRPLDQIGEQGHAERRIGRSQHGNILRGGRDPAAGEIVEAGRPDKDRNSRGDRAVEAGLQRGRRGEVHQNIAPVLIDLEPGIVGDGGNDRFPHPALRSEQADPDGLLVGAHGAGLRWRAERCQAAAALPAPPQARGLSPR